MRDFLLLPGPPSQVFSMLALWDQCLYMEWEFFFPSWEMCFFLHKGIVQSTFLVVSLMLLFEFVLDFSFNIEILEFGNCGVFWWLGNLGQSYKEE